MMRAAKAVLPVKSSVAENGGPSNDMFFADLDEKADSISSAKVTLRTGSAQARDKNDFKEAVVHCVSVERNLQK